MKRATRKRISDWIERNRPRVLLFSGMAFIFGLLMENRSLGLVIRVVSLGIVFLFMLPIERMIDGIG